MSAVSRALAFVQQGDGDLEQYRRSRTARAMKLAAGKPPVNLKAARDALAAAEASPQGQVPSATGAGAGAAALYHPATVTLPPPESPKCLGCGVPCTVADLCHTCGGYFCVKCDQLPAPPRNHALTDHLKTS